MQISFGEYLAGDVGSTLNLQDVLKAVCVLESLQFTDVSSQQFGGEALIKVFFSICQFMVIL